MCIFLNNSLYLFKYIHVKFKKYKYIYHIMKLTLYTYNSKIYHFLLTAEYIQARTHPSSSNIDLMETHSAVYWRTLI